MLDNSNIGKLGRHSHNTQLFVGVVRNENAIARSDNPNLVESEKTYQEAREKFITDTTSAYDATQVPTCADCTIEMAKGFHIHHEDGDHTNNDPSNFKINCPFCHMTKHLGWVGVNSLGFMVYAPQIPQATLNQIQIIAYAHEYILNHTKPSVRYFPTLKRQSHALNMQMQALESTKAIVLRDFKTTDPLHFANAFVAMSEDEYTNRHIGTFSGLRVMFDPSQFQKEIEMFAKYSLSFDEPSNPNHPSQWIEQAKQIR
ncbi:HNH endonuclease [Vibrio tubiashii]|uniref:HNH endonuclease n=1 Tax=Vibrio tubiashii TaxID=29498 RepID=UPI001EFD1FD1|nr:HNH endonuclease [Vibrio tubiashii]MCG9579584.1 HNH endonuclease [Vibrio tubiashii]